MKKLFTFALLFSALFANATGYLNEKFDSYGAATLLSDPSTGWFVNPAQDSVTAPAIELVKPEYGFHESVTHVATFAERTGVSTTNKSRMDAIKLTNNGVKVVGPRTLYAAVRLQVVSSGTGALSTSWFMGLGDSTFTRVCGKVYIVATASPNTDFKFAISKSTDAARVIDPTLHKYGTTHLLIIKYKQMSDVAPLIGTAQKNDSISLYVNPDLSKDEVEPTLKAVPSTNDFTATQKLTFVLNQKGPGLRIGSIVVTDSWSELNNLINPIGVLNENMRRIYYNAGTIITPAEGMLKIYTIQGCEIVNEFVDKSKSISLAKGVYITKFKANDGKIISGKIVVSK